MAGTGRSGRSPPAPGPWPPVGSGCPHSEWALHLCRPQRQPQNCTLWSLSRPGLCKGLRHRGPPTLPGAPACLARPTCLPCACLGSCHTSSKPVASPPGRVGAQQPTPGPCPRGQGAPTKPPTTGCCPVSPEPGGLERWPASPASSQPHPEPVPSFSHSGYATLPILHEQPPPGPNVPGHPRGKGHRPRAQGDKGTHGPRGLRDPQRMKTPFRDGSVERGARQRGTPGGAEGSACLMAGEAPWGGGRNGPECPTDPSTRSHWVPLLGALSHSSQGSHTTAGPWGLAWRCGDGGGGRARVPGQLCLGGRPTGRRGESAISST